MRVIRDDPQRPSLVIRNKKKFLAELAATSAAVDAAVARAEWLESWFPMLRVVREARAQHIRVRQQMYERARDKAMWERIERRLQAERDRRAELGRR